MEKLRPHEETLVLQLLVVPGAGGRALVRGPAGVAVNRLIFALKSSSSSILEPRRFTTKTDLKWGAHMPPPPDPDSKADYKSALLTLLANITNTRLVALSPRISVSHAPPWIARLLSSAMAAGTAATMLRRLGVGLQHHALQRSSAAHAQHAAPGLFVAAGARAMSSKSSELAMIKEVRARARAWA